MHSKFRSLEKEVIVNAPLKKVWEAWTTKEGMETFFAPECNVDLRPDGLYEVLFLPENAPGQRGAEGMRVMAVDPMRLFSFTWSSPPHLQTVREQRKQVTLKFEPIDADQTIVYFSETGWVTVESGKSHINTSTKRGTPFSDDFKRGLSMAR